MSGKNLRHVIKSKIHKERSQPADRARLGLLEKKKDYKLRAADHNRKIDTIQKLKQVAANRNPDEFATAMVNSQTKDGVHTLRRGKKRTFEELKTMKTQDINYLTSKQQSEAKAIERLQSELHCLDENDNANGDDEDDNPKPVKRNNHVIFVDDEKKVTEFNAAQHFDTAPELVNRTFNRPKLATLEQEPLVTQKLDRVSEKKSVKAKAAKYSELAARLERKEQVAKVLNKLETEKKLQVGQEQPSTAGEEQTPMSGMM